MQSEAARLIRELLDPWAGWKRGQRERAVESLVALGPVAVPELIEALRSWCKQDSFPVTLTLGAASGLVRALGRIGDPAARQVLEDTLHRSPSGLGRRAAEALGELGDRQAVPCLVRTMEQDRYPLDTRNAAVLALSRLAELQDTEALCRALWVVLEEPGDEDHWLRSTARTAVVKRLISLRAPEGVAALLAQPFCEQVSPEALAEVGIPGIPALVSGLDPDARFQIGRNHALRPDPELALRALLRLGPEAVPHLWGYVGDPRSAVSSRCAIALCALGAAEDGLIAPVLLALERAWSPDFAIQALEALVGKSRNPALRSGIPSLQRLGSGIRMDGEARARCRELAWRIWECTSEVSTLPISAGASPVNPDSLPLVDPTAEPVQEGAGEPSK